MYSNDYSKDITTQLLLRYSIETKSNIEKLKLLYKIDRDIGYDKVLYNEIVGTEESIPGFIMDFRSCTTMDDYKVYEEEILARIVIEARRVLRISKSQDSTKDSLFRMCQIMSSIVEKLCSKNGIEVYPVDFENYVIGHRALLLKLKSGNIYLMDLTYQQFFLNKNNMEERHVTRVWQKQGPYVGYHMIKDGYLLAARKIIEKGFISVDSGDFKQYMDSIIKSFYTEEAQDYYLNLTSGEYIDIIKSGKEIREK